MATRPTGKTQILVPDIAVKEIGRLTLQLAVANDEIAELKRRLAVAMASNSTNGTGGH